MVRHAAIQCLCWFTVTVLYYGLGYSAGSMAGDLYYNAALLAVADIPGNLLYSALADGPRWVQPSFLDRFLTASLSLKLSSNGKKRSRNFNGPKGVGTRRVGL
eukprot:COSAG01_NODE_12872_length_1672_cov_1.499682_2_plen_103_part_00